jgi:hypothetical protein
MMESQSTITSQLTEEVEGTYSSEYTIIDIRRNIRKFGTIYAPQTRIGRKQTVTALIIEALCDRLYREARSLLDKMTIFL